MHFDKNCRLLIAPVQSALLENFFMPHILSRRRLIKSVVRVFNHCLACIPTMMFRQLFENIDLGDHVPTFCTLINELMSYNSHWYGS